MARIVGRIAPGYAADLIEIRRTSPPLDSAEGDWILAASISAMARPPVTAVMAGGRYETATM